MAESQVPFPYPPQTKTALRASISEPRFATYLAAAGKAEALAFDLYLYNARVAKAFLFPLHVTEVTLRNAIDQILTTTYGPQWPQDQNFTQTVLSPESLGSLSKAITRAGPNAPTSQTVATLTFDFWSNLFRPEYGALWRTELNIAFPHLNGKTRHNVQQLVRRINEFRNRVAHHEPVLDLNANAVHADMVALTAMRCPETANWMKHHSTVAQTLRTRPRAASAIATLASKHDAAFISVARQTSLSVLLQMIDPRHPAIVCSCPQGKPLSAFSASDVAHYLSTASKEMEGMIDLNEHSVGQFLDNVDLTKNWVISPESTLASFLPDLFMDPAIRVLVTVDEQSGITKGAISRAHRRY